MKYLLLVSTLLCGPAYATNIWYALFVNEGDVKPNYFYLTNTHSDVCELPWFVAKMESNGGKVLNNEPICWSIGWESLPNIKFPKNNEVFLNVSGFTIVPRAIKEWKPIVDASREAYDKLNALKTPEVRERDFTNMRRSRTDWFQFSSQDPQDAKRLSRLANPRP
ncbi:hypothetical protein SAMN05216420_10649 [Nitrosospira sp. Nl5]|uniref:hypothetical protein n=1 Tax=Nitrosospira sp. Nl5 TaxID=200120 RepID=UPI0008884CFA|nr:hypothetical protein [Nitrosospira sp. Nl5]SCY42722.1 hypothetical protein SAMN05216420_10649 [Nitrosospira sp. Nl5]